MPTPLCGLPALPAPTLHLSRDDIPGTPNRGNGAWLLTVAERLKLHLNQIVLVGTSELDWRTGINAGVAHVLGRWANHVRHAKGMITLSADEPADVRVGDVGSAPRHAVEPRQQGLLDRSLA
ncbi:hypothetical protein [Streptomyces durhamensis]|uniref:hypothetical protein n=1 Tax=Streptomyces durhamensis TaxID=68194 RepID=UPI0004CDAAA8|nr:hypothetical protein [Streptomyces durhamensis]